jgi:hypothetical protein
MTNNWLIYMQSCRVLGIKSEDFNLEGVIYDGENWYFNRGNEQNKNNIIYTLHAKKLNQDSAFSNDCCPK